MAKPSKDNEFVLNSYDSATVGKFTFCILAHYVEGYRVRVFPHNELDSYWLPGGPWETLSGCKASILNFLDESED